MWPFKTDRGLENRVIALETASADLQRCCESNALALEKAASALPALRADVDLQWEKVNRAIGRFAKRDATEAEKEGGNGEPSPDTLSERILRGDPI